MQQAAGINPVGARPVPGLDRETAPQNPHENEESCRWPRSRLQAVNEFRKKTGLGLMECKALLKEADGDVQKAETLAKERASKRPSSAPAAPPRPAAIEVYIHHDAKSGHHGRAQLRDRLRRPQRRVQAARQGHRTAHHGGQSAVCAPRGRSRKPTWPSRNGSSCHRWPTSPRTSRKRSPTAS